MLSELGLGSPVVAAPMAGGPTTPDLVLAAGGVGALGFLAGGYLTADALAEQIARVEPAGRPYGVNLFAPHPVAVDPAAYARYRDLIGAEAARRSVDLPARPLEDDDGWRDKVAVLVERPAPVVSFTFGLPDAGTVKALRAAGSLLLQTVTSADEARRATEAGVDGLVVQASAAGGHSGTFTPERTPPETPLLDLVPEVLRAAALPVLAAGGISSPHQIGALLAAGADGVVVGTALLLADEAGTSAAHRAGLLDHDRETAVMCAFTGRPARGLRNAFSERYDAAAPLGYPAVHHLTRPIRRAAAAAEDPEAVNLWAGTGFRDVRSAPAAVILTDLAAGT